MQFTSISMKFQNLRNTLFYPFFAGVFTLVALISACRPDANALDQPKADVDSADSTFLQALYGDEPDSIDVQAPDSLSYLALGDSYTIGQSVAPLDRWPVQLVNVINATGGPIIADPQIIAQTGWTTANLSDAMDAAGVDAQSYDLVSLLIGVNNQYQGLSSEEYAEQYEALLQRTIAIAGDNEERVFVLSIPDYGYTPFGLSNQSSISAELETFNQICADITEAYGVTHYNITPISQQWPEVENLIATDNLHPSGYQYSLWVESIWEGVQGSISAE